MKMDTVSDSKGMNVFFDIYNGTRRAVYRVQNILCRNEKPIVFFGDSITDRCDLKKYYPGLNVRNRGISGNTVIDLINRFDLSVKQADPSMIVLLIGINDLMNLNRTPEETAGNYDRLLYMITQECPDVPLYCQSVYPGYDAEKNRQNKGLIFPLKDKAEDIVQLNAYIKELCQKYNCTYIDVHSHLKMEDNTLNPEYSYDGCHPNDKGYKVAAAVVSPYIR